MADVWSEPLQVQLLQWLVRGSLKQNLPQASRLWAWLQLLYGEQPLPLPARFNYADCRAALFTETHPKGDRTPSNHDPHCPCHKPLAAWLFSPYANPAQVQEECLMWAGEIESFKSELIRSGAFLTADNAKLISLLQTDRPFEVSRRTLSSDLRRLCELGWLHQKEEGYERVTSWPEYPTALTNNDASFLQPDLAEIATNLSSNLFGGMGEQRFFVHTDYVVPKESHDRVGDWQDKLKSLWQQTPEQTTAPPLKLTYWSASYLQHCEVVVYPVCIYYYRRGPYLCAWGQVPEQHKSVKAQLDWRNYRLDKIIEIEPLSWQASTVPEALLRKQQRHQLPHPDEIQARMDQVWGFDYYQSARELLVRFDAEWDERYIRNSLRHATFKKVSYEQARSLIQTALPPAQSDRILAALSARFSQSAYYQARYRHNDPNVRQRLRAWRPHIEVILPWDLRQQFAKEVAAEQQFYQ